MQRIGLLVRQHVLTELGAEARQPLVDAPRGDPAPAYRARRPRARSGCDSARAREPVRRQAERFAAGVEIGDAGIERAVEIERIAVTGEQRRHRALDRLDGVAGIGAGQHPEQIADPLEHAAASFQRGDGVVEGRRSRVGRRCASISARCAAKRRVESRAELLGGDGGERRQAESAGPVREQRDFGNGVRGGHAPYLRSAAVTRATPAAR